MIENFVNILNTSAPWLIIGFFVGGLIHSFLPLSLVRKYLQKDSFSSCVNASLIGLPMPLCSCSVLPVALSLRDQGASKGATASFLVSTPEIGVDSALLSYGLLGLPFTLFRIVSSAVTAIVTGASVTFLSTTHRSSDAEVGCCGSCDNQEGTLRYAFIKLPAELAGTLSVGFILAALFPAVFSEQVEFIASSSEYLQILIALVVSFPTYVCSVGATPIAASLLFAGVYPGAVLVFLLCGPATNIATVLAVKKMLGIRESFAYVISIVATSVLLSVGFSFIFEEGFASMAHQHEISSELSIFSIILLVLLLGGFVTRLRSSE